MDRPSSFFRGSEFPRLMTLAAITLVGWCLVWSYAGRILPAHAVEPEPTVQGTPKPIVSDLAPAFETVTDRTPIGFRDSAGYGLLLERARAKTPGQLAEEARRDLVLAHLWERPELYRGVPVHILGTVRRILYYESKLSKTGWLYEAWIFPNDERTIPYVCVFEEAPKGLPIGPAVSERVVFNGYFLKVMRYTAGDVVRGAPVLVGPDWLGSPTSQCITRRGARPDVVLVFRGARGLVLLVAVALGLAAFPALFRSAFGSTGPIHGSATRRDRSRTFPELDRFTPRGRR